MRLPHRRILWLSAAVLLAVVVGAWSLVPRSRVDRGNFDRIQNGMTRDEVMAILGQPTPQPQASPFYSDGWEETWSDGPSTILVRFQASNRQVIAKDARLASAWQTLTWYARKGAAKIGVSWE
jgi:SmpA / OmlA family